MTKIFHFLPSVIPALVLGIVTVFLLWGLSGQGMFRTHDGEIHIIRSIHFYNELQRGQFPVRMAPELAYGFGYSIFQFFYPLPYYCAALFQFAGFSTVDSWKLMEVVVTCLSLWVFYRWMRCTFDKSAALVATILFALVPFRVLTLYVTGQIGGYFSLLCAPLIGWGIYKTICTTRTRLGGILITLGIFGILTSHLLSAIIFFLPLVVYTGVLLWRKFSWEKVLTILLWIFLGIGLSSFYVLPFLLEKSWVKLGHSILVNHRDHWTTLQQLIYSPWGYGYSNPGPGDDMSFQVGLALLVAWFMAILLLIINKKKINILALSLTCVFAILFILMLPVSEKAWDLIIPLQLLQYPWRILAATALVGAWLSGWTIHQLKGYPRYIVMIFLVALAVYNVRNYVKPWPLDWQTDQNYIDDTQAYYGPTDISWELMPITAKRIPTQNPQTVLTTSTGLSVESLTKPPIGPVRITAEILANQPTQLIFAIWDLPVWQIRVNDTISQKIREADGTIGVSINSGISKVEVVLIRTPLQKISDSISILSFILLCILIFFPRKTKKLSLNF